MALAMTPTLIDDGGDGVYVYGTIAASGNYATGGDTLDFTTIQGKGAYSRVFQASALPVQVAVYGTTGDSYGFVPGTTLANGKVKINTASNTELGAGAYPARITGDTGLFFEAVFAKNL